MGDRFALFALGSLANMATFNPLIQIPGNLTHLGHSTAVYEPWFAIVWSFIAGAQLGVLVVVGWLVGFGKSFQVETQDLELGLMLGSNTALVGEGGNPDLSGSGTHEQGPMDTGESTSTE